MNSLVNGNLIKCMGKESLHGQMVENTKVITKTIKKKVTVYLLGLMVDNMMDYG